MNRAAILHVTSPFGGGVDRHIRDIVRGVDRPHLVWHAGERADVIEEPRGGRFFALAADAVEARGDELAAWLRSQPIGLVHLHQFTRAPRERAEWSCRALHVPRVATLHDVLFLRPDAFAAPGVPQPDTAWLAQTVRVLRESRAVFAPSRWLANLAETHAPGLTVEVVPNGWDAGAVSVPGATIAPREAFVRQRPAHVVALLGALGPHKGSGLVEEVAARLEGSGIALVLIGYSDRDLLPGWRIPGRLFVHGAFADGEAAGLLRGYGAKLALMTSTVPESFSYALSEAWAAGVPVLASPLGALAERIGAHGGGWLLPEAFDAGIVAREILALAGGEREPERARVQSQLARPDPARIPSLDAMTRSLDAFYARFGIDPAAPDAADAAALESLLARNLDGSLFRQELVRLSDELAQTLTALDDTTRRSQQFESEARRWIAKLEEDVRAVQENLRLAHDERDRLAAEADLLRLNKEALDRLPSPLRRLLLRLAFDARR